MRSYCHDSPPVGRQATTFRDGRAFRESAGRSGLCFAERAEFCKLGPEIAATSCCVPHAMKHGHRTNYPVNSLGAESLSPIGDDRPRLARQQMGEIMSDCTSAIDALLEAIHQVQIFAEQMELAEVGEGIATFETALSDAHQQHPNIVSDEFAAVVTEQVQTLQNVTMNLDDDEPYSDAEFENAQVALIESCEWLWGEGYSNGLVTKGCPLWGTPGYIAHRMDKEFPIRTLDKEAREIILAKIGEAASKQPNPLPDGLLLGNNSASGFAEFLTVTTPQRGKPPKESEPSDPVDVAIRRELERYKQLGPERYPARELGECIAFLLQPISHNPKLPDDNRDESPSKKRGRKPLASEEETKRYGILEDWKTAKESKTKEKQFCDEKTISLKYFRKIKQWARQRKCRADDETLQEN